MSGSSYIVPLVLGGVGAYCNGIARSTWHPHPHPIVYVGAELLALDPGIEVTTGHRVTVQDELPLAGGRSKEQEENLLVAAVGVVGPGFDTDEVASSGIAIRSAG